jgi:hypothetical protein
VAKVEVRTKEEKPRFVGGCEDKRKKSRFFVDFVDCVNPFKPMFPPTHISPPSS